MSIIPVAEVDVDLKLLIFKSVSKLCYFDHGNDKKTIDQWVEKANDQLLISNNFVFFDKKANLVKGFVGIKFDPYISEGEITHLYVHPECIKQYIGDKLLDFAEKELFNYVNGIHLLSTITARHFYLNRGYYELRAEKGVGRSWNFAMAKYKKYNLN